ncbi:efflux RND transporter periplasmic adaptor subunit [Chondromyces apiculatus]|uniref:Acriflavin resistance protein n=1 Tax=Chondromyces apiculatus DSM 436 TaxID=1192034 RepID=A0A017T7C7_9BACT|nr:efflux RND transporter periplasmic adaptor subunit [Chondromyces apiculatus]EYF04705.1 Acriflavin resistance protein [Chondromyces apiculatus DSM 436]
MSDQLSSDLASLRIQRDVDPDRRSPLTTVLLVLAGLGAVGGIATYAVPRAQSAIFKTEIAMTEVALVSPAQASITVTSTGYVVPQVTSRVGSKIPGRVAKIHVKEGDVVKTGDLIAELDDSDQRSAITAAQARVAAARARALASRANLTEVQQQVDRERALVEQRVTGRATFEDLSARLRALEESAKASEAEASALAAEVGSLRVGLNDRKIFAPINGTVVTKPPEVGESIFLERPFLMEITDFGSLVVETDVPESRLSQVEPGKPCEVVLDAYPTKRHRCTTLEIGKRVNRAKATVPVKVKFTDETANVLPEMSARVSFLSEALSTQAMKEPPKRIVPESAIVERAGAKMVFVVDQGQVKMTPVKLGAPAPGGFEMLDGPAPGTRLVSNPPPDLADGQKIKEKEKGS